MGVGTSESETVDTGSSGRTRRQMWPWECFARHLQMRREWLQLGIQPVEQQVRGDYAVLECHTCFKHACDSRRAFCVSNDGLYGSDMQYFFFLRIIGEERQAEGLRLLRVTCLSA